MTDLKTQRDPASVAAENVGGQRSGTQVPEGAPDASSDRDRRDRIDASVTRVMRKHRAAFAALAK